MDWNVLVLLKFGFGCMLIGVLLLFCGWFLFFCWFGIDVGGFFVGLLVFWFVVGEVDYDLDQVIIELVQEM